MLRRRKCFKKIKKNTRFKLVTRLSSINSSNLNNKKNITTKKIKKPTQAYTG